MKKFLSTFLAFVMVLSVFTATAFAAGSKTEDLLDAFISTKSCSIKVSDIQLPELPIKIDEISANVRGNDDGSFDAILKVKIGFLTLTVRAVDDEFFIYLPFPRIKLDLTQILGEEIDLELIFDEVALELASVGEVVSSTEENISGFGKVTVETIKRTPKQVFDSYYNQGLITVPDGVDISTITDEEALAYIATMEGIDEAGVANLLKSNLKVYFKDDKVVELVEETYNADGSVESFSFTEEFGISDLEFYTGVDDKAFNEPMFYFDFTPMLTWIILLVAFM